MSKIVKQDINYFQKLLGIENVYSDKAHLVAYSYDATRNKFQPKKHWGSELYF